MFDVEEADTLAADITAYMVWDGAGHVAEAGPAVVALTSVCLSLARAWEPSVLGQGSHEFARLLRGFLTAAVIVALVSLATQRPCSRV